MYRILQFSCLLAILIATFSCKNDNVFDGDAQLDFSVDTLRFDTVFTELGTATRFVKIYNEESESISLSEVKLLGGAQSFFRLNVDGVSGAVVNDVRIAANDSVYIFVEATIDPDNPLSVSPYIIEDQIQVSTSPGISSIVQLEAWGQNANYINGFEKGEFHQLPCITGAEIWDDPKPYVIYGVLVIDNCQLTIAPGTSIYVHGGVVNDPVLGVYNDGIIVVGPNGSVLANGTLQDSITIQGDRLETEFDEVSGQWGGVIVAQLSRGNKFSHTTIKNSLIGLRVDSAAQVDIDHGQFYSISGTGLLGIQAEIKMSNSLIHSTGGHALQCSYGGDYTFDNCTIASYGNDFEALRLDNYFCRFPLCLGIDPIGDQYRLNAIFTNCIVTGSQSDELFFDDLTDDLPGQFNYRFDHSIVSVDTLLLTSQFGDFFTDMTNSVKSININSAANDTLFVNTDLNNYHLDTLSVAENRGLHIIGLNDDLEGVMRDPLTPDIGCYEYVYP